jgi:DHA1 family multidrug resistance protein-like MFS transporter
LFLIMVGFGMTRRFFYFIASALRSRSGIHEGSSGASGTADRIFALMQFLFAPLSRRWSDRVGLKPLVLVGVGGFAAAGIVIVFIGEWRFLSRRE